MAVSAKRTTVITYSGDTVGVENVPAADNAASPGQVQLITLSNGFNTITLPTGGSTVVSCTILPPVGNTKTITLKGITTDDGVALHLTDPTTIALASSVTTFGLTTNGTITGMRLYYT